MVLSSPQAAQAGHCWYAAYTFARHEKKVADQLDGRGVEFFLPAYKERHRWRDRYKVIQMPLFPGYVFVRIFLAEKLRVLEIPSVVHLVSFGAAGPMPVPDDEVASLRSTLAHRRAEPHPYLPVGNRVRVTAGPLQGLEGTLVRSKGGIRFVVSVDLIMKSIAIEVDAADLQSVKTRSIPVIAPRAA
jgi:transcription antitermination factor NusG